MDIRSILSSIYYNTTFYADMWLIVSLFDMHRYFFMIWSNKVILSFWLLGILKETSDIRLFCALLLFVIVYYCFVN